MSRFNLLAAAAFDGTCRIIYGVSGFYGQVVSAFHGVSCIVQCFSGIDVHVFSGKEFALVTDIFFGRSGQISFRSDGFVVFQAACAEVCISFAVDGAAVFQVAVPVKGEVVFGAPCAAVIDAQSFFCPY